MQLEFRDWLSIASLCLFPLFVFAMRSFIDSLKKEIQITLNTQLEDVKDRIDRDYVAKDMWLQHNAFADNRLARIENRVGEIGQNVHNYNNTVMKAILNMETENSNERMRVARREHEKT